MIHYYYTGPEPLALHFTLGINPQSVSFIIYSFWLLLIISTSIILPASSDSIQVQEAKFSCFDASLISSSMLSGTHNTTPHFRASLGSQGWKGNTVHFRRSILSVVVHRIPSFKLQRCKKVNISLQRCQKKLLIMKNDKEHNSKREDTTIRILASADLID